ncbi:phage head morphogenesis protein, partial [Pasteurella multocida]
MMMNLPEVMKGQKKPRIVRFKPIKQSRQTELWYSRQLVSRVKWLREQIERALQNKQSPFFMDSDFDVFNTEQLLSVIKKLSEKDRTNEIESLASEFVSRGNVQNQREVGENLKRQTGLDLQAFLNQNTTVLNKMSVMTTANVQLIKS